jgi:uncharacterized membrane-anchored protein YitT (DUF2179 family)
MKIFYLVLCSLLIALVNVFVIMPYKLVNFGFMGVSELIAYKTTMNPGIVLLIFNAIMIVVSTFILDIKKIKPYLATSLMIPIFMTILYHFSGTIKLELPEMMLVIIFAGFTCGFAYGVLYKQGNKTGTIFILDDIINKYTNYASKYYSWIFDIILLFIYSYFINITMAIYSLIIFAITKIMVTKSRFGISDSKMFYIITSKEKEVREYITDNLGYDLSTLDVKGGYTNKEKKIIISVIDTNDFYKLKEGVKVIDKDAFITITDTYDVISKGKNKDER